MATSNLIRRTLGDVELQSGNGTPDHNAPIGSQYVDRDTGKNYYCNGGTSWGGGEEPPRFEGGSFDDETATTNVTITTQNVWSNVTDNGGFTWAPDLWPLGGIGLTGQAAGSTYSALEITVSGTYIIYCGGTIQYGGSPTFSGENAEFGIGINGADPVAGDYGGGAHVRSTDTRAPFQISTIKTLNSGDLIQMFARNLTNTDDIPIESGYIRGIKIG